MRPNSWVGPPVVEYLDPATKRGRLYDGRKRLIQFKAQGLSDEDIPRVVVTTNLKLVEALAKNGECKRAAEVAQLTGVSSLFQTYRDVETVLRIAPQQGRVIWRFLGHEKKSYRRTISVKRKLKKLLDDCRIQQRQPTIEDLEWALGSFAED